ncbi:MAG: glycosyltransferase family 2 protein [Nitrososphaeraceae archaeon]
MIIKESNQKFYEMSKKRWTVRYIILITISSVLLAKIYFMIFVVDFVVGLYSFLTTLILFNMFFFAFLKYKDPYKEIKNENVIIDYKNNLVSIIIPVKNEKENIENCVMSCINSIYPNKEIIVVNDASTDDTPQKLDKIQSNYPSLKIIHLKENVGKKKAIEVATKIAQGKFYVFMDSDCNMAEDAIDNAVKIFFSDKEIGAVTAHGKVRDAENGNILEKIQDVWFDGQFRILKGMESSFSSLTCCSGALSIFRREAIQHHMYDWAHDKFLGTEFKFATDRRLTAFILGESNRNKRNNKDNNAKKYENDKEIKEIYSKKYTWKIKYSPSIKVEIGVPRTMLSLIKQQIRWRKSFIRSIFATGSIYWKRPLPAAILYYLTIGIRIFRPYIVIKSLILLPTIGDFYTGILYVSGAIFTGMMYGIDVKLRNPGYTRWKYRPLMTMISTFILSWLIIYAAITIKNKTWR